MSPSPRTSVAEVLRISLALTLIAVAASAAPAKAACNKHTPCPVITVNPPAPVEQDDTPVGTTIAHVVVTLNPPSAGPFTGTKSFGPPYGNGGGLFALSGSDVVLVAPFPDGSSVQHFTLVAQ